MDYNIKNNTPILVIGDVMLDHYITGECNRISPEAPVPVVEVRAESYTLGGAGNVVKNLSAFNCNVDMVCVVGNDVNANIITSKLSEYNVSSDGIVVDNNRCTTIKTRVLAASHQLIRLDREETNPISIEIEQKILKLINQVAGNYQVILLSDYNKGVLTTNVLNGIIDICRKKSIITIVDPKGVDFSKYKGVNIIKPNKKEAILSTGIVINDIESLQQACMKIKEITNCDDVVVTMSEDGIALYSDDELKIIPTKALDVVDVTGAGDTVLASLGVAIAAGNSLGYACDFANHAAAVVVSKIGSATATLEEINGVFFT